MKLHNVNLSEIASIVGEGYVGSDVVIGNLNLCNRMTKYEAILSYTTSERFFEAILKNLSIKAIVTTIELKEKLDQYLRDRKMSYIISNNPEVLFYDIHLALWKTNKFYDNYNFAAQIGENCNIHNSVVIEDGVIIGNNVTIGPNSVIRRGTVIEDNVVIGCCSVIGSEGFQGIKGYPTLIKHVGGTLLCHDVYVGDCSTIGNALFEGSTVVGAFTKIDNHVHFAHNCQCGEGCFITASSLLMGSTTIEDNVWLAPNAVTLNGTVIRKNAFVGTLSFVNKDVPEGNLVAGIPAKILHK